MTSLLETFVEYIIIFAWSMMIILFPGIVLIASICKILNINIRNSDKFVLSLLAGMSYQVIMSCFLAILRRIGIVEYFLPILINAFILLIKFYRKNEVKYFIEYLSKLVNSSYIRRFLLGISFISCFTVALRTKWYTFNPTLTDWDPWGDLYFAKQIIYSGFLPEEYQFQFFELPHKALLSYLTANPLMNDIFITRSMVIILSVASSVMVFILFRRLLESDFLSILFSLLFFSSKLINIESFRFIARTYAYFMEIPILYVSIFCLEKPIVIIACFLGAASMFLYHPGEALALTVALAFFFIWNSIRLLLKNRKQELLIYILAALCSTFVLLPWVISKILQPLNVQLYSYENIVKSPTDLNSFLLDSWSYMDGANLGFLPFLISIGGFVTSLHNERLTFLRLYFIITLFFSFMPISFLGFSNNRITAHLSLPICIFSAMLLKKMLECNLVLKFKITKLGCIRIRVKHIAIIMMLPFIFSTILCFSYEINKAPICAIMISKDTHLIDAINYIKNRSPNSPKSVILTYDKFKSTPGNPPPSPWNPCPNDRYVGYYHIVASLLSPRTVIGNSAIMELGADNLFAYFKSENISFGIMRLEEFDLQELQRAGFSYKIFGEHIVIWIENN
jgi:hypothetical protein